MTNYLGAYPIFVWVILFFAIIISIIGIFKEQSEPKNIDDILLRSILYTYNLIVTPMIIICIIFGLIPIFI